MKALVLQHYNQLVHTDVPEPEFGAEDVLIRVRACGICGSDVHGMDGSTGRRRPPLIMGHEAAGVIAATGSAVSGWKTGDRVTFDSTIFCGDCPACRRGQVNLCRHRRVLGVSCAEYRQDGAFAEFIAVPARILHRLPDPISFEDAALIEPYAIAQHAAGRHPLSPGSSVLVVGCGMIGLALIQTLRLAGAGPIIAVDQVPEKLHRAEKEGAVPVNSAAVDPAAAIHRLTDGAGVDAAFEAVGLASTVQLAIHSVRPGGAVTLVGNLSPRIELPLQDVVTREVTLHGSCASSGEYPACLDLMARGQLSTAPLRSAVAPLSEGAEWFARLAAKDHRLLKVVLVP